MRLEALVAAACRGSRLSVRQVERLLGEGSAKDLRAALDELTPGQRELVESLDLRLESVCEET